MRLLLFIYFLIWFGPLNVKLKSEEDPMSGYSKSYIQIVFKLLRWVGWVGGWLGGRVAGWPGGRVAGWPGGRVAGWPGNYSDTNATLWPYLAS